jgi:hypothetical protein
MSVQVIDYKAVLIDLENKRATFNQAVDSAIASIKQILALIAAPPVQPALTFGDLYRNSAEYKNLSLAAASIKQLHSAGQPLSNQEIAKALDKVGFTHGAGNFANQVGTALWREKKNGKIYRDGKKWYLAEWRSRQAS